MAHKLAPQRSVLTRSWCDVPCRAVPCHCVLCRPVRPDAAVLVAAKHDVYVDMHSVKALQVRAGCKQYAEHVFTRPGLA